MIYTFKPFEITKELEDDCLQLSKEFFEKLAAIKEKHGISSIQISNDWHHGLSYNLFIERQDAKETADSVTHFLSSHPLKEQALAADKTP